MDMRHDATHIARREGQRAAAAQATSAEFLTFRLGGENTAATSCACRKSRSYEEPTRIT
ncbi:hypothetical protein [Hydrogenophaga sp.]|uniref:hypothetical protein n=1 Tax=Hydrogenophaga sp. TaxID=1904254 RepID=UPI0025C43B1C|nr:hypothetical protein [Hydrogenophaga sp.]